MAVKQTEKVVFARTKLHCNIGTIGHVDHGKTTLTAAITKVLALDGLSDFKDYNQIDSHKEEKERGITINAAHVEYETKKRHYTHIDCPGHQDYIKNMIIGASQMEGVILVVAATDGVQVQTREHVILAKEIGIPYMLVFINKIDAMKERSMLDLIELEIRELIESYSFSEETPFVRGSALKALQGDVEYMEKIKELMNFVDSYIPDRTSNILNENFLMPVEGVITVPGRGTVVTGKVEKGSLKVGDNIELVGDKNFLTSSMGIEMHRKILDYAESGDNIGVLLKGVARKDIKKGKGYVLATPNTIKPATKFEARVYILSAEEGGRKKPFKSNYKPQFFFRVSNVTGSINLKDVDMALPGETVLMEVELLHSSIINENLRFILREGKLTVGAGFITKVL